MEVGVGLISFFGGSVLRREANLVGIEWQSTGMQMESQQRGTTSAEGRGGATVSSLLDALCHSPPSSECSGAGGSGALADEAVKCIPFTYPEMLSMAPSQRYRAFSAVRELRMSPAGPDVSAPDHNFCYSDVSHAFGNFWL